MRVTAQTSIQVRRVNASLSPSAAGRPIVLSLVKTCSLIPVQPSLLASARILSVGHEPLEYDRSLSMLANERVEPQWLVSHLIESNCVVLLAELHLMASHFA